MASIADFSIEELAEELARRARNKPKEPAKFRACDDCSNFIGWHDMNVPDDYNPCKKGHKMSFKVPETHSDIDWGFYRNVCPDRNQEKA